MFLLLCLEVFSGSMFVFRGVTSKISKGVFFLQYVICEAAFFFDFKLLVDLD